MSFSQVAARLGLSPRQVETTAKLLSEDNTVPFITRYRRDATGGMDEDAIRAVQHELAAGATLKARKAAVSKSIDSQGKLSPQLRLLIDQCVTLQEVEDAYLPFKQKKKTLGSVAREKGAGELGDALFDGKIASDDQLNRQVNELLRTQKKHFDNRAAVVEALGHVVSERIADCAQARGAVRKAALVGARLSAALKDTKHPKADDYRDYHEFTKELERTQSHQILAINRAEEAKVLRVSMQLRDDRLHSLVWSSLPISKQKNKGKLMDNTVWDAVLDAWKRLIAPAAGRELRKDATERAVQEAIATFKTNLRAVLLVPPVRGLVVLAIDPGFRSGCKLAVVDATGAPQTIACRTIFPHPPQKRSEQAITELQTIIEQHGVDLIAVGDGTACHETEQLVSGLISRMKGKKLKYTLVSENGASVYSVSKAGQTDLPDMVPEERSAISLARRLQDPLAELVKVEPEALGVGMYQHDMPAKQLSQALTQTVESVVNHVGVDVNTASSELLTRVAGLNSSRAQKLVAHREKKGPYVNRQGILDVAGIGKKTYEQCAGFLRVYSDASKAEPLDRTEVHPESYSVATKLLKQAGLKAADLCATDDRLRTRLTTVDSAAVAQELGLGEMALQQVLDSLSKPGHDPRSEFSQPKLREKCLSIDDLEKNLIVSGVVKNVVPFGAFVDIGVGTDGLLHSSQVRRLPRHIQLAPGVQLQLSIGEVDKQRKRIGLNATSNAQAASNTTHAKSDHHEVRNVKNNSGSSQHKRNETGRADDKAAARPSKRTKHA